MTLSGPRLHRPVHEAPTDLFYATGSLMQVSPTEVALFASHKVFGQSTLDYAGGSDVVIFDRLDAIRPERAMPLLRNDTHIDPDTGDEQQVVKYLVLGGFVPLGAKRSDGRPHPHAGTGFGLSTCLGHPPTRSTLRYHELQQYRYDGKKFEVVRTDRLEGETFEGWTIVNRPLANAIPDGDDLLMGLVAARPGERHSSGLSRWRCGPDGWRPVAYVPVTGPYRVTEPTLVRDADGSLLMSVRSNVNVVTYFRVYRSEDNGENWELPIYEPDKRSPSPVGIIAGADGEPFLVANPHVEPAPDRRGRRIMPTRQRETLCLWPINPDRSATGQPAVLLDARARFGPPRDIDADNHSNLWLVDHPTGGAFHLADGKAHNLLCFRVTDVAVNAADAPPTDHHGCWVEQLSVGPNP